MNVRIERIKKDIDMLATFSDGPDPGVTRFSYSNADKRARQYLLDEFDKLGLTVTTDGVGNLRARLDGLETEAAPVMTGSHIDTVLHGGKFDGVVGVVGALETVRVLLDKNIKTKHPVEIVVFAEEEGSNFGVTMAGSKTLIGKYSSHDFQTLKNDDGIIMYELLKKADFKPDDSDEYIVHPGDIKAMIELHVEQSVVLDNEEIPIGIVEKIAGIKTYKIEVIGVSNHAGATPMHLRKDPMQAAARIICEIENIARKKAKSTTVATVGKIFCYPNVSNVIPEAVHFFIDIRDVDPEGISLAVQALEKKIEQVTEHYGVEIKTKIIGEAEAINLSRKIIDCIRASAVQMQIPYKMMNSGAVHDSSLLASVTEVGMIFVPSIDGRSHVPNENTSLKDIEIGCELLFQTIVMLAN